MSTPLFTLRIIFTNGSQDEIPFCRFSSVQEYYRNRISYTGGRVARVEVDVLGGGTRAIWDITWNAESKHAGLYN